MLEFNNLPSSYIIFRPDGNEIDTLPEGGEVQLTWTRSHFITVNQMTIKGEDLNFIRDLSTGSNGDGSAGWIRENDDISRMV